MPLSTEQVERTEHWFVARGVPHLIANYRATEDVLTRALPILTLIFVASSVSAIDTDWPAVGIAFAVAGGVAILIGGWALLNRWRGRRPLARPDSVGLVEIGAFVLFPAALPVIFGTDWSGVAVALVTQLSILALVYAVTSYGLVAIAKWAGWQLVRSLTETFALFARGLPLLLLGFMFLFINAEAWQAAGQLEWELLAAIFALFLVLGSVFVITQIPREIGYLSTFGSWSEVDRLAIGSPVEGITADDRVEPPALDELSNREWANIGLVVFVSQGLRILLVSLLVGGFFVAFGLLIVRPETMSLWIQDDPELVWRSFRWFGQTIQLTEELLQVSGFLASFAGLYFSVYTITDPTFRTEFFEDIVAEVRESLAVRALYRAGSKT